jgi:predicted RNA binding protein YcfA (HicA-like mRNA interferase family)
MPRITSESWSVLKCIFSKVGFGHWRKKGSHHVGTKTGCLRPIVIPEYKDVDTDIIRGLMRTAKLPREDYFRLREECR